MNRTLWTTAFLTASVVQTELSVALACMGAAFVCLLTPRPAPRPLSGRGMQIRFGKCHTHRYDDIVRRTIDIVARELGIAHYARTLHVHVKRRTNAACGSVCIDPKDPDKNDLNLFYYPDRYRGKIPNWTVGYTDEDVVHVITHEMYHVRQYWTGKLSVVRDKKQLVWSYGDTRPDFVLNFDLPIPYVRNAYGSPIFFESMDDTPWEKEAYEKTGILARKIIAELGIPHSPASFWPIFYKAHNKMGMSCDEARRYAADKLEARTK